MTQRETEAQEAIARLRKWVKPGDTLFCNLRHVSRSGMQRSIQLIKIERPAKGSREPKMVYLGYNAAKALGWRYDRKREGVIVGGCGMDMGFHLVYELAHVLFPRKAGAPVATGSGETAVGHSNDKAGGYALRHRWL